MIKLNVFDPDSDPYVYLYIWRGICLNCGIRQIVTLCARSADPKGSGYCYKCRASRETEANSSKLVLEAIKKVIEGDIDPIELLGLEE